MNKIKWLIALSSLFIATISTAHFHYKISATATLQANAKKQLTAINLSWLHDKTVSDLMLKSGQSMEQLASGIANDLVDLDNFTQLKFNGRRVVTGRVTQYQLVKIKDQMKFSFTLPLKSPLFIQGGRLSIAHTDPGASASIFYHSANSIELGNTFESHCKKSVQSIQGFEVGDAPEAVQISCRK
ncbi:MAG: DUF1007 family protein [Cocleimonas sp.]|nr:DUF1007 family protein [Cocleimonas sp.]